MNRLSRCYAVNSLARSKIQSQPHGWAALESSMIRPPVRLL